MKIDKHTAYKIAGSGFKLLVVGTGEILEIETIFNNKSFNVITSDGNIHVDFDEIGQDFKIISRTMDLTKPITVQGKEVVPLIHLAYTSFPEHEWQAELIEYSGNTFVDGIYYRFGFINNDFRCINYTNKNLGIENQPQLFQWLEKHHFCYFLPDEMIVKMDEVYNN